MDKQEMFKVMTSMRLSFPNSYGKYSEDDFKAVCQNWYRFFKDDDYGLVQSAVDSFVVTDTTGFAPSIGQIKEMMYKLTNADSDLSEQEAWEYIRKACRNALWYSKEEHAKLPTLLQKIVTPQQLQAWARLDIDEFNTVVASNFMRSYKSRKVQQKEYDMLPNTVKQMISTSMKMIGELDE